MRCIKCGSTHCTMAAGPSDEVRKGTAIYILLVCEKCKAAFRTLLSTAAFYIRAERIDK